MKFRYYSPSFCYGIFDITNKTTSIYNLKIFCSTFKYSKYLGLFSFGSELHGEGMHAPS